jgi:hypothetical protein
MRQKLGLAWLQLTGNYNEHSAQIGSAVISV